MEALVIAAVALSVASYAVAEVRRVERNLQREIAYRLRRELSK